MVFVRETYWTIFMMLNQYGYFNTLLIVSFLSSAFVFVGSVLGTFAYRLGKSVFRNTPPHLASFAVTLLYSSVIALLDFHDEPGLFASTLVIALLLYFIFVLPLGIIYGEILRRWNVLPWHFIQYCLALAGSLAFWALLIYHFKIFELGVVF